MGHSHSELIKNLRPALKNGAEVRVGLKGQTHNQIPRKPGEIEAGFVDLRNGVFLTRAEAAGLLDIPGLASLDSQKLNVLQTEQK